MESKDFQSITLDRALYERALRWMRQVSGSIAESDAPACDLIEDCADLLEEARTDSKHRSAAAQQNYRIRVGIFLDFARR